MTTEAKWTKALDRYEDASAALAVAQKRRLDATKTLRQAIGAPAPTLNEAAADHLHASRKAEEAEDRLHAAISDIEEITGKWIRITAAARRLHATTTEADHIEINSARFDLFNTLEENPE